MPPVSVFVTLHTLHEQVNPGVRMLTTVSASAAPRNPGVFAKHKDPDLASAMTMGMILPGMQKQLNVRCASAPPVSV